LNKPIKHLNAKLAGVAMETRPLLDVWTNYLAESSPNKIKKCCYFLPSGLNITVKLVRRSEHATINTVEV